ncbi:MAG: TMEM165/GDT1 family protein [Candidatus Omnitrophica bacterium]|jgi:putative Ca2+/H+ antiporter (TMEM165/GDT1 family)|nr:TMEM165/GDT1 family protein [Candidatus Omnitrophota bacterium]
MDWKIFSATFAAVFVAELADKTQLVGITMASKSGKPAQVWMGSVAAYIIVTAVSVLLGAMASKFIKPDVLKDVGAVLFVLLGILMFLDKI